MKKLLSLILAVIVVCTTLASCSTLEKGDKGAFITMYLADEIYDYDPTLPITDTATAQILSLMYEGLTVLDENGNWKKGMMKSYKYIEPEEEGDVYKLQITLRDSKWSDGRTVQASDFVYAWKRIMEQTNKCESAALLYDVKNARAVKMGDASVDDLGVYAIDTYVLEVQFERDVDLDEFFRNAASLALVPLRDDSVMIENWSKRASSLITNGPFDARNISYEKMLMLERSSYYYRDTESNQALDKYVIPYRIYIFYENNTSATQLEKYEAGTSFYLGQISLAARKDYSEKAEVKDAPITTSVYFNTTNELFAKAEVRQALSIAIDRQAIAESLVFAKAATGFVPYGVKDADGKGDFREVGGDILDVKGNVDEAKSLLSKAGVNGGSFKLTTRDNETDVAIAEAVAETWRSLNFDVEVVKTGTNVIKGTNNQSDVREDVFQTKYETGDFDVILVDYNMITSNAFSALAPFATEFSGNGITNDKNSENYEKNAHVTGYNSEDYAALIETALAAGKSSDEMKALHDAEKKLLEDMPVAPIVFQQDAYVVSDVLSGVSSTYWGRDFKRTKMKDYMTYKESLNAELNAETEPAK